MRMEMASWSILLAGALLAGGCERAVPEAEPEGDEVAAVTQPVVAQCGDYNELKNPYFGDLHDHTSFSLDARGLGTVHDPADALAFAQGTPLTNLDGVQHKIDRPLDFAIASDHSEYLAVAAECFDNAYPDYSTTYCASVRASAASAAHATLQYMTAATCDFGDTTCIANRLPQICKDNPAACAAATSTMWAKTQRAANDATANHPCTFTAFNAYEWTATPNGNTMHRIVLFADNQVPPVPLDYLSYPSVTSMLTGLGNWKSGCAGRGCDVLTIPHNSNQSAGLAWNFTDPVNEPGLRATFDRLVEVHQHKGNSECPNDPNDNGYDSACNFEVLPNTTSSGYVRDGLQKGLLSWAQSRVNPFQFGFVGATDNHNASPGEVKESTWKGHLGYQDDTPGNRLSNTPTFNPGGITGVWAKQNTRAAIFDALKSREVFATSGPRILVRFYQTWTPGNYCSDPAFPSQIVAAGGKPMGQTMGAPPSPGAKPTFVIAVWKDSTPLETVHLVKGTSIGGVIQKPVVVPFDARPTPSFFCTTTTDSTYVATDPAFYYVRAIEAASPRWSKTDCATNAMTRAYCNNNPGLDVDVQERAYTSPIFNLP